MMGRSFLGLEETRRTIRRHAVRSWRRRRRD